MVAGVLQQVSLAYQLFWNRQREVAGVRLHIRPDADSVFATGQLIAELQSVWSATAPPLLLACDHTGLLSELLALMPVSLGQLEITSAQLAQPAVAAALSSARQRGVLLVWRGEPGEHLLVAQNRQFHRLILSPSAEEALAALHAQSRQRQPSAQYAVPSPLQSGQCFTDIASRALVEHCLDQQQASAVLGWPGEDVVHDHRATGVQPDADAIRHLLQILDADASMDAIEQQLGADPLLCFRFLRFANSAGLGLQHTVESLRQGLMVLGLERTRNWLQEQMAHANHDINLKPVRNAMRLRARLMAQMLHAGEELTLRRELYLCGLLSQLDLLFPESLAHALKGIALPERVKSAILGFGGPYQPYLDMARALDAEYAESAYSTCVRHDLNRQTINQALLHTLTHSCV